jgi:hypothetical protein
LGTIREHAILPIRESPVITRGWPSSPLTSLNTTQLFYTNNTIEQKKTYEYVVRSQDRSAVIMNESDQSNTLTVKNGRLLVGGNVNSDLTLSGSILVQSSLTVAQGVTLTIQPGSTFYFKLATDVYDKGPPKGAINVLGRIYADGATFTSDTTASNYYWAGIYVLNSNPSGGNYVKNFKISHCKFGFTLYNSRFEGEGNGIFLDSISYCLNPIKLTGGSRVDRIGGNHLLDNIQDGIVIYESNVEMVNNNEIIVVEDILQEARP